jgi:hypothetical protein
MNSHLTNRRIAVTYHPVGTSNRIEPSQWPETKLRAACMDSFLRTAQDFERDLAEAKAAYAAKEDFDPKNLAMLFVTIIQGSIIMAKAAGSNAVMIENLEQFRRHLEFLFGRSHKPAGNRASKFRSPRHS